MIGKNVRSVFRLGPKSRDVSVAARIRSLHLPSILSAQTSALIGGKTASKPLPQCTANVRFGSKADKTSLAKIQQCPLLSKSGQNFSHLESKASWSSSVTEEYDHARHCQFRATGTQTYALEQGQTDRRQATAAAEACLGDPNQAQERATNPRSGAVQSGHRQQVTGLRCLSL